LFVLPARQLLLEQQPAHEVGVHAHRGPVGPITHAWPLAHIGFIPHPQTPDERQVFARSGSHVVHSPVRPQYGIAPGAGLHLSPEQHPSQLDTQPVHTPSLHSPSEHGAHSEPPLPQAAGSLPGWHEGEVPSLSQQPAHDVLSHTHMPMPPLVSQRRPGPQAGPVPQRHVPLGLQLSAVPALQATHAPPIVPHAPTLVGDWHCPNASQQPLPHDRLSQMQVPLEHRWPVAHGGLLPHAQAPLELQLSASVDEQVAHVAPLMPQLESERGSHTFERQHPSGQEEDVQRHIPSTHCWPLLHAGPVPQRQTPPWHMFAVIELHGLHAAPLVPHSANVGGVRQVAPAQHPVAQFVEVHPEHAPALHV
jgi:hypothetical protein